MSDYIPDAVVVQILLRVPSKSLSEFRLVCKLWYSLINDPDFISKYTHLSIKNANHSQIILRHYDIPIHQERYALHYDDDSFSQFKELDFLYENRSNYYEVIGLSFGLVCLLGRTTRNVPRSIVIWNPSLETRVKIRARYFAHRDPIYGFGFDSMNIDYKVVRIVYYAKKVAFSRDPLNQIVHVFALNVGKWKDISATAIPPCFISENMPQAFLNEALHWVGVREENRVRRLVLALFDLNEDVFKEFNIPNEIQTEEIAYEKEQKLFVGVLDQRLALMHYYTQWYNSPSYDGCCIWMMNGYGVAESWTKQFKIDLRLGLGKIVGLRRNGEILLVTRYNRELISFDTVNRKIHRLGIYSDTWTFYMDTYMESLVLMKRVNGVSGMPRPSIVSSSEMEHCSETSGVETTNGGNESRKA